MQWRHPQIKSVRVRTVTWLSDRILTIHVQCPDFHPQHRKTKQKAWERPHSWGHHHPSTNWSPQTRLRPLPAAISVKDLHIVDSWGESSEGPYFMIYEKYMKFKLQYPESISSWLPLVHNLSVDALVIQWNIVLQQGMYGSGAKTLYYHLVLTGKACRPLHLRNRLQGGSGREEEKNTWKTLFVGLLLDSIF